MQPNQKFWKTLTSKIQPPPAIPFHEAPTPSLQNNTNQLKANLHSYVLPKPIPRPSSPIFNRTNPPPNSFVKPKSTHKISFKPPQSSHSPLIQTMTKMTSPPTPNHVPHLNSHNQTGGDPIKDLVIF